MKISKVLITGTNGQLGYDVYRQLLYDNKINEIYHDQLKYSVYAPNRDELDITNRENVMEYCDHIKPDFIVHCAGYSKIDEAEVNQDLAFLVNFSGTKNVCEAAKKHDSTLVFISSSYVFDGTKAGPYTELDGPNPINTFGLTKYLAEQEVQGVDKHIIIRTSWLYGIKGNNFVRNMISLAESGTKEVNSINNQVGNPTYTRDAAYAISKIMDMCSRSDNFYGIYNVSNECSISWAGLAKEIFTLNKYDVKVNNIKTEDYIDSSDRVIAHRPLNSRLNKNKIYELGVDMPDWDNALRRFNNEYKKVLRKK